MAIVIISSRTPNYTPGSTPRHGHQNGGSVLGGVVKVVAISLAVALVSSVSVAAIAVGSLAGDVARNTVSLGNESASDPLVDVGAIEGGVNMLIVGSDTRLDQLTVADSTGGARNDVTMLMHISQDHQRVTVVSIPRDTMITMPSCKDPVTGATLDSASYQQFNTALGRGGLACVVKAAESVTGLTIPYAGMISFDGVTAMTNVMGGVDVCIAKAINDPYSNVHLAAGQQTLSGEVALGFLRTREGVGDGSDLARISSQQVYLSALVRKMLSEGTLTNPLTIYGLAKAALSNMQFSSKLASLDSMVSIAKALAGVSLANVAFLRYPVMGDPEDSNRVVVNGSDAKILNAALLNDTPLDLSRASTAGSSKVESTVADPSATSDPTASSAPSATSDPTATETPAPTTADAPVPNATAGAPVRLPDSFTGQTASQVTCSVGN
jgi:LCP family protein required for cell wall assembly